MSPSHFVVLAAAGLAFVQSAIAVPSGMKAHPFLLTGGWGHRKPTQTIFIDRDGKVTWTYDIPIKDAERTLQEFGDATLLPNANIVFCRKTGASEVSQDKMIRCPADLKDPEKWPDTVQVLEVTPEKKVVWALNQWNDPDLGPASSIQLLDEPDLQR